MVKMADWFTPDTTRSGQRHTEVSWVSVSPGQSRLGQHPDRDGQPGNEVGHLLRPLLVGQMP